METLTVAADTFTKTHWTSQEQANVALIADFIEHLMNKHDFDYIDQQFGHHNYVQHNRTIKEGIAGVIETVRGVVKRYPEYTYDVKHVLADGDQVIFHSHATMNKKDRGNDTRGFNITDRWRIQDGQIVEHWDSVEPINGFMRFFTWLTGGKVRNGNGVF
ncbi:MAG: nuclear transport factor 2 family protein [Bacteroidota bacterium]